MRFSIHLTRAEGDLNDFAFQGGTQRYLLIDNGAVRKSADFEWDAPLLQALGELNRAQPSQRSIEYLGRRLSRFLDALDWDATRQDILDAARRGEPVLLSLRFSAAELFALPWEFVELTGSGEHLGQLNSCVIHYEWPGTETAARRVEPPPLPQRRVLYLWSDAAGSVPYEAHSEALSRHAQAGWFAPPELLPRGTYRDLGKALERAAREGRPFHTLHLLCHGREEAGTYGLVFNDPGVAEGVVVLPRQLQRLLSPHAGALRQVVICACHGARMDPMGSRLGGVAQALHRAGIETVLASRLPLSVSGSVTLTQALYGDGFSDDAQVETAFLEARRELAYDVRSLDYAAVQLYRRSADVSANWLDSLQGSDFARRVTRRPAPPSGAASETAMQRAPVGVVPPTDGPPGEAPAPTTPAPPASPPARPTPPAVDAAAEPAPPSPQPQTPQPPTAPPTKKKRSSAGLGIGLLLFLAVFWISLSLCGDCAGGLGALLAPPNNGGVGPNVAAPASPQGSGLPAGFSLQGAWSGVFAMTPGAAPVELVISFGPGGQLTFHIAGGEIPGTYALGQDETGADAVQLNFGGNSTVMRIYVLDADRIQLEDGVFQRVAPPTTGAGGGGAM